MSVNKKVTQAIMNIPIDPAIQATIENNPVYGKLRRSKNLTEYQRRKVELDANRTKATFDLSPDLKTTIESIATKHKVSNSQIASLLLIYGLKAIEKGELDIYEFKVTCWSPRYEFTISLPKVPEIKD